MEIDIKKIVVLITMLTIFTTLMSEYVIVQQLISTFKINKIHDFQLDGTERFRIENGIIINLERDNYAFPIDKLELTMKLRSTTQDDIRIDTTIKVSTESGIDSINSEINNIRLYTEGTDVEFNFPFRPMDEGVNQIDLHYKIYNFSNGLLLDEGDDQIRFKVYPLSAKLQDDANITSYRNFILAIVIGCITAGALIFGIIMSRRQIEELKKQNSELQNQTIQQIAQNEIIQEQFKKETRSWVALDDGGGKQVEFELDSILLNMKVLGKSIVQNAQSFTLLSTKEISVIDILRTGKIDKPATFAPNESFVEIFNLPVGVAKVSDLKEIYIGIFLRYQHYESKYGATIIIMRLHPSNKKEDEILLKILY